MSASPAAPCPHCGFEAVESGGLLSPPPCPHSALISPKTAAALLGRGRADFVYDLITEGKVEAIPMAAKGTRPIYSITRRSVLAFVLTNANFSLETMKPLIRQFLELLDPFQLAKAAEEASALLESRSRERKATR